MNSASVQKIHESFVRVAASWLYEIVDSSTVPEDDADKAKVIFQDLKILVSSTPPDGLRIEAKYLELDTLYNKHFPSPN